MADLQGMRFVITGELDFMERDEAKRALEALGARVTGSVSGKTDVLVVGRDPGASKLAKADKHGTERMTPDELKALLAGGAPGSTSGAEAAGNKTARKKTASQKKSASKKKATKKKARKRSFREASLLKKVAKLLDDYKSEKAIREITTRVPAEQLSGWLWDALGRDVLPDHYEIQTLLAKHIDRVPLSVVAAAIDKHDAASKRWWLPGFGERARGLLRYVAQENADYLRAHISELARPLQLGCWIALGGDDVPEDVREEVSALLPAHVASRKMQGLNLGRLITALGISSQQIYEPVVEAIAGAKKLHILTVGCVVFRMPSEQLLKLVARLDFSDTQPSWYKWWIERRVALLPDETPEQHLAVFEALLPRVNKCPKWLSTSANVNGAFVVANTFVAAKKEVPDALFDCFYDGFDNVREWMPIFATLSPARLKTVVAKLEEALPKHSRCRVMPLSRYMGQQAITAAIDETVAAITNGNSVSNQETKYLGLIGGPALEPLLKRIDKLQAKLTDDSPYKSRAVVAGLRQSLGIALGEVAAEGHAIEPRFDAFLGPDRRLFNAHDHVYRFLNSDWYLFRRWILALPQDRLRSWIDAWKAFDPANRFGTEGILERLLGDDKKHMLRKISQADRVRQLAEATGMPCTQVIYGLTRSDELDPSSFNRILAHPTRYEHAMELALALDLSQMPALRERLGSSARVLALFVDKPDEGFEDSELVGLSEEQCGFEGGGSFVVDELRVPPEVFTSTSSDDKLATLLSAIYSLQGIALAPARFIQESWEIDEIILQAGERLTDLNLGDSGELYVFPGHAMWQCY